MNYKYSSTRPDTVETVGAKRYLNFDIEEVVNKDDNISSENQYRYLQAEGNIFNWDYAHLVAAIIRAKYSADDVEAIILNNGDGEPEHKASYNELQAWRKHAKDVAREVIA